MPDVIVQDNNDPQAWKGKSKWLNDNRDKLFLGKRGLQRNKGIGKKRFLDFLSRPQFEDYNHDWKQWQTDLLSNKSPMKKNRLLFKTKPLKQATVVSGTCKLHLRVASSADVGMISAQLVDFGNSKRLEASPSVLSKDAIKQGYRFYTEDLREFKQSKTATSNKMISFCHLNLQNRKSPSQNQTVTPHHFYDVEIKFQPTVYHLPKGRQLGLALFGTDFAMTNRFNQKLKYAIDLRNSYLEVPFEK